MVLLFVAPLMGLTGDQVAVQCLTFCLSLGMDTLQGAGEKEKISVESAHHQHQQHSVCEVQLASNKHTQKRCHCPTWSGRQYMILISTVDCNKMMIDG